MSTFAGGRSCIRHARRLAIRVRGLSPFTSFNLVRRTKSSTTTDHLRHAALESGSKLQDPSPVPISLSNTVLSYYWDTAPPTSHQLALAERFFLAHPPSLMYSASKFRTVNMTSTPEVAFLGRSNVGKSSLLNALLGRNICHTSSKPGRTRTMNGFAVGGEDAMGNPGRLVVLDMMGYGKGSRDDWGTEIMKYLLGRKQYLSPINIVFEQHLLTKPRLRRTFLLVDALHGLKSSDEQLLALFRQHATPHQVILSKVDRILWPGPKLPSAGKLERGALELKKTVEHVRGKVQPTIHDGPGALGEILTCSAEKSLEHGKKLGINSIRWAILAATGLGSLRKNRVPSEFAIDHSIATTQLLSPSARS